MTKKYHHRSLLFLAVALIGMLIASGCNKKSDDNTSSGSGATTQSVLTLKGAGQ